MQVFRKFTYDPPFLFEKVPRNTAAACLEVELSVGFRYLTESPTFTMLAEMPVAAPAPNTFSFAPPPVPQSSTVDTLLAISTLQNAFEHHALRDLDMVNRGYQQLVEKPDPETRKPRMQLHDLPVEIHESILDHLFGVRASTSSSAANGSQATRGWSNVLRHPRRKQLSNLALVSPLWRRLVQERLYRHSKSHVRYTGGIIMLTV